MSSTNPLADSAPTDPGDRALVAKSPRPIRPNSMLPISPPRRSPPIPPMRPLVHPERGGAGGRREDGAEVIGRLGGAGLTGAE